MPYTFKRLDSFTGYEAGMPSPQYYQSVWESGQEKASEELLRIAVARLRQKNTKISAADLIASRTIAEGLARMRGHRQNSCLGLLNGMAAALLKDAQDAPLPWSLRGPIRAGTDPILVETWSLAEVFERESAIIEAAAYGATLLGAVSAWLEEAAIKGAGDLAALTTLRRWPESSVWPPLSASTPSGRGFWVSFRRSLDRRMI